MFLIFPARVPRSFLSDALFSTTFWHLYNQPRFRLRCLIVNFLLFALLNNLWFSFINLHRLCNSQVSTLMRLNRLRLGFLICLRSILLLQFQIVLICYWIRLLFDADRDFIGFWFAFFCLLFDADRVFICFCLAFFYLLFDADSVLIGFCLAFFCLLFDADRVFICFCHAFFCLLFYVEKIVIFFLLA